MANTVLKIDNACTVCAYGDCLSILSINPVARFSFAGFMPYLVKISIFLIFYSLIFNFVPDLAFSAASNVVTNQDTAKAGEIMTEPPKVTTKVTTNSEALPDQVNQANQAKNSGQTGLFSERIGDSSLANNSAMSGMTFSWSNYIQALGGIFILLAGLCLLVWLMRRFGRFSFLPRPDRLPKDSLVMEMQMPLGPRKGLVIVRFMERRLLLGITEQQISLLAEDFGANEQNSAESFQNIMDKSSRLPLPGDKL